MNNNNNTYNLQIVEFRQQLNNLISNCNLDAAVVYYIIKDVYNETERQYREIIEREYQMMQLESDIKE